MHSSVSTPNLAPGRRQEKRGPLHLHPLHHLLPTTAARKAAGVCTSPWHLLAAKGALALKLGGAVEGQLQEQWKARQKGVCFLTPMAQTAQTHYPTVKSSPPTDSGPGLCLGSTLEHGRAQKPHSGRFPRDMAPSIFCGETVCTGGCPKRAWGKCGAWHCHCPLAGSKGA